MDFKQIQELLRLMSKSDLSELKIEQENFKITLKKDSNRQVEIVPQPYVQPVIAQPVMAPVHAPAADTGAPAYREEEHAPPTKPAAEAASASMHTIKSPMIGTFYRSAGPDKEPFVKVGDIVKAGQTLCIIEAMKLFNEIESEVSGKVVKVLTEDASPAEYDQPLFIIDTSAI